jgi:hypothetical protein
MAILELVLPQPPDVCYHNNIIMIINNIHHFFLSTLFNVLQLYYGNMPEGHFTSQHPPSTTCQLRVEKARLGTCFILTWGGCCHDCDQIHHTLPVDFLRLYEKQIYLSPLMKIVIKSKNDELLSLYFKAHSAGRHRKCTLTNTNFSYRFAFQALLVFMNQHTW